MDLRPFVDSIHQQLADAADAGGDEARALAERLAAPLDAAIRLALQDALAAAAAEITSELAPGSVELRLRGRNPEFVVTPPPAESAAGDFAGTRYDGATSPGPFGSEDVEDGGMSRINLRMPEHLKARVERAASSEGVSVNSWLVRAAGSALDRVRIGSPPRWARRPGTRTLHGLGSLARPYQRRDFMPTFATPAPIIVTLDIGVGDIRITASNRAETTVEVRPTNPAKQADVAAAGQTQVEFSDGHLQIRGPKGWRRYSPIGPKESIDVQIELPEGSQLRGEAGIAALHGAGTLGECKYTTGVGDIQLDRTGPAHLSTGVGDVSLDRASGRAQISSGSGTVRIGTVDGTADVKGANGDTWIGDVSQDLRIVSANGSISVGHAHATVVAKTANGDIRIGDVESGTVVANTALGKVEIGIGPGVAAWLDLDTHFGKVHNELDAAGPPKPGERAVDVRARTSFGDITVHRAVTVGTEAGVG